MAEGVLHTRPNPMEASECKVDQLLPTEWPSHVQQAILHTISLARTALTHARGWTANSLNERVRLQSEVARRDAELALEREEQRIKDRRILAIPAPNRPRYPPAERMAILELRAARGWSLAETARRFHVEPETIAAWMTRLDEQGEEALVKVPQPVNKYPEFIGYMARRLKTLCPLMGRRSISQTLARAGLRLSASSVKRMTDTKAPPGPEYQKAKPANGEIPVDTQGSETPKEKGGIVTARHAHHVWHMDLTLVPAMFGFWVPWLPFSQIQRFPFCWWVAVVVDHYTRKVVALQAFAEQPSATEIGCRFPDWCRSGAFEFSQTGVGGRVYQAA